MLGKYQWVIFFHLIRHEVTRTDTLTASPRIAWLFLSNSEKHLDFSLRTEVFKAQSQLTPTVSELLLDKTASLLSAFAYRSINDLSQTSELNCMHKEIFREGVGGKKIKAPRCPSVGAIVSLSWLLQLPVDVPRATLLHKYHLLLGPHILQPPPIVTQKTFFSKFSPLHHLTQNVPLFYRRHYHAFDDTLHTFSSLHYKCTHLPLLS